MRACGKRQWTDTWRVRGRTDDKVLRRAGCFDLVAWHDAPPECACADTLAAGHFVGNVNVSAFTLANSNKLAVMDINQGCTLSYKVQHPAEGPPSLP